MTVAVMPVRAVTFLGLLAVALACAGLPLRLASAQLFHRRTQYLVGHSPPPGGLRPFSCV